MNLLVTHLHEFETYYNCSLYNFDVIPRQERQKFVVGIIQISLFVIFEFLYIPTLYILFASKKLKGASFRLMLILGMVDSFGIVFTGLFHGIFSLNGTVYCSNPVAVYAVGFTLNTLWFLGDFIGVLLAFNRCLVVYDAELANILFEKGRYLIWILPIVMIELVQAWFFIPSVYNSVKAAVFMNPHTGYDLPNGKELNQYFFPQFNCAVNVCVAVIFCIIYLAFFGILRRRNMKLGAGHISATEKNVFLQVIIISTLAVVVNLGLVATQLFTDNLFIAMMTSISWPMYQGAPSIIYLSMNKTIHEELKAVSWKKKINTLGIRSAITPQSIRRAP